ncbi:hypothetical protein SBRCBS47491_005030 [Sporothrix bragantina]|uniref:Uncharacterized protein n=1 Tax=Sporothrix bragantina TaxID=671064 RepID=A0ABP0BT68_9PEZI
MGANQSHSSSSSSSHSSSRPTRSSRSALSSSSGPTLSRSGAIRHRTAPMPAPGSGREFLILHQQLVQMVQEETYKPTRVDLDIFGDSHNYFNAGYNDGERYVTHATTEHPGFFPPTRPHKSSSSCRQPGQSAWIREPVEVRQSQSRQSQSRQPRPPGTTGLSLSRTHAVRSSTSPTARAGSRRDAMLRASSSASHRPTPTASRTPANLPLRSPGRPSPPRSSRPSPLLIPTSGMVSFHEMGIAAPTSPLPPTRRRDHSDSRFRKVI